jgi:DNA-binding transcriptional MocR family regulator
MGLIGIEIKVRLWEGGLMSISSLGAASLVRHLGAWRSSGNGDPAYRQLARALKLLVLDGRVGLGIRFPGERELAQALGVSRTTVAAAFDQLRDEGYLQSRQGSGSVTRIPDGGTADTSAYGLDTTERDGIINWTAAALPAPETVWHAYEAALGQLPAWLSGLGYDALGIPRLRQAIAADYARRGCPTDPAQIMVTSGAQHALALLLRLMAAPGDRIVVDHPTYHNALFSMQKSNCVPVPVGLPDEGWDIEAIGASFRQTGPRLAYIIADFHNPTGRIMDAATRRALVDVAERSRTPLLIDETMADMALDGDLLGEVALPPPVAAFDPTGTRVISIGSASKRLWGGLRIGWIRADEQMIAALARIRATIDMATPIVDQLAVAALLDGTVTGGADRRAMLRDRRDRIVALLARHLPDWRVPVPAGGLSLWAELPRPQASALAAMAHSQGLLVAPGPRFGVNGAFERFVRLPFTLPDAQIEPAVERLAAAAFRLENRAPAGLDSSAWALEADRVI